MYCFSTSVLFFEQKQYFYCNDSHWVLATWYCLKQTNWVNMGTVYTTVYTAVYKGECLPAPGKMLMTPLGNPALAASSANFSAVSGVTLRNRREEVSHVTGQSQFYPLCPGRSDRSWELREWWLWSPLIKSKLLPTQTMSNKWKPVGRICMLVLGVKKLIGRRV